MRITTSAAPLNNSQVSRFIALLLMYKSLTQG
ncbi:hypothetical protein PHLH5_39870 [Pseudomonas sp. Cab53]|nr:hypothetical protein PHLH5_39870 [Pseudomonas sp. Cab53]